MTQVSQLLIYTYVYSVIFKVDPASRGLTDNNPLAVGLWIFSGLLPWWGFSSGLSLSASAVIKQTNLVKKVVFPLALLPPVSVLSAFIESLFGLAALLVAYVLFIGTPHTILILLPLVWIPQLLLTLGLGYLAAALTVFLRDIPQTIRIILNIWFYLTPIVYPVTLIPEPIRVWVFRLNPMAIPVQVSRDLFMKGEFYDWIAWGSTVALTSFLLYIGISVYQKLRPAFADVL
jgi:lipopolysaccharide transport system permease protein